MKTILFIFALLASVAAGAQNDLKLVQEGALGVPAQRLVPAAGPITSTATFRSQLGIAPLVSPAFTTPDLGVATAASLNGNFFTAGSYTLTGTAAKTLTFSNTLTFAGTDGSTLNIGTGGTLGTSAYITLGANVGTALGVAVGNAGAFVTFNGAGGTPSSLVGTNITGTASGLTAGNATNVATTATTTNASFFPLFVASSSNGNQAASLLTTFTINPSTGNVSTPGSLTTGAGGTVAGGLALSQGTTLSTGTTNITIQAPAAVTSYIRTLPGAVGSTGFLLETVSGSVQTESLVAATGMGSVVLSASPTLTGTIGGASLTLSSLTSGRATYAGASGLLSDEAAYAYNAATNILTVGGVSLGAGSEVSTIGPLVDSVDGTTPLNNVVETVAAGTAYTLTTTYANVVFGTTSPVIVLPNAGTYMVYALFQTTLVGATATTQVVQGKCRRTNNTAADVGFASAELLPPGVAASIPGIAVMIVGGKYTTTNTNDSITIQAQLSAALGAGTVTVSDARIWAVRQY